MELLPGFKPHELIGVIFGLVSLIFAWLSFRRATRSEQQANRAEVRAERAEQRALQSETQARELLFAQRKAELLARLSEGESAHMRARRQLMAMRDRAFEARESELVAQMLTFAESYEQSLERLRAMRRELAALEVAGRSHEELRQFIEAQATAIQALVNSDVIDEEVAMVLEPADRHLRQRVLSQALEAALEQRGLNESVR